MKLTKMEKGGFSYGLLNLYRVYLYHLFRAGTLLTCGHQELSRLDWLRYE